VFSDFLQFIGKTALYAFPPNSGKSVSQRFRHGFRLAFTGLPGEFGGQLLGFGVTNERHCAYILS